MKFSVTKIAHFSGHKDAVFVLQHSIRPNHLYSGGGEGYIVEWDLEQKGDGKLIVQVNRPVYSLFVNSLSNQLYAGTASGNLHVIDLAQKKEIRNIEAHQLGLFDMKAFGNLLITSGGDGLVKIWDLQNLDLKQELSFSNKSARVIALHPNGKEMAVGYSDHHIRLFDTTSFSLLKTIPAHNNSVFALSYSPDGKFLLSGGRDVMLRSWKVNHQHEMELDIPAHTLHINSIAYSPDKKLFATVSMDKTLKVWDAENFQLLKVVDKARNEGHLNSVNKVLWINNTQLATCSDDRTLMIWELVHGA